MLHASHGKYFFDERSITAEAILKDFFIISHVTTVLGERFGPPVFGADLCHWTHPFSEFYGHRSVYVQIKSIT